MIISENRRPRVSFFMFLVLGLLLVFGCAEPQMEGTPEEVLERAWKYYALGEFNAAIGEFTLLKEAVLPDDPFYAQALYGLGTTWNLRRPRNDPDTAREYYLAVLEHRPGGELAAYSLLALARMKHLVPVGQDPDYDEVRDAYRRVVDQFPDHPAGHEAFIYLQSTHVATLDPDHARKAIHALRDFMARYPDTGFISAAWSLKAIAYDTLGDPDNKLTAEIMAFKTEEVDPQNPFHDNAWRYWSIAVVAEFDAGDFETARTYYRRLIEEYPTDIRKYSATQALERMDEKEAHLRAHIAAQDKGGAP